MRGRDVEVELFDQSRQPGGLSLGKLEHEPGQGGRVDDGMLERALQAAADEPSVERIVAVLDQHRAARESQEGAARVTKFRCADEHRAVDVVAPVGIRVDRRPAVDKRVEERQRAVEAEPFRSDLQNQERSVSRGLDVEGHELSRIQLRLRPHLGRADGDLLPPHRLHGSARLEEELIGAHRATARARRAQSISSLVNPRRSSTALL